MSNLHHIRTVRIDVPLHSTCAYLYVDADHARWDPWWGSLYEYLLGLEGSELAWRHEPTQNVFIARPQLSDEQRNALARFLRTAPAAQVDEHRTLRRAVQLSPEQEMRLEVVYFSGDLEGTSRGPMA